MKKKIRRRMMVILKIMGFTCAGLIILAISISLVLKFLIEKYDEKYTGRQIEIGWIRLNPVNGHILIYGLRIFEANLTPDIQGNDSVFFSVKKVYCDIRVSKLFSKTLELSSVILDGPKGTIIQDRNRFNFSDLLVRFKSKPEKSESKNFKVNVYSIRISDGKFYYYEKYMGIGYFIKDVSVFSPGLQWNTDTIGMMYSFSSGLGTGSVKGTYLMNYGNLDYQLDIHLKNYDLSFIEQYLKDITNYGHFKASIDADINSSGNFSNVESGTNKGAFQVYDFHIGKDLNEDYASFEKLLVSVDEISPSENRYFYDSIVLVHPFFKYEQYDVLDNLQTMFGEKGAKIAEAKADAEKFNLILKVADYLKVMAKNFIKSDFRIKKVAIYGGNFQYNNYSLFEKFSLAANTFEFYADSVYKGEKWVNATINSGIDPYGKLSVGFSINTNDSGDFDLKYQFLGLPATLFNPFVITYTSFPMDRGTVEVSGNWKVRNGFINSRNHLLVVDPRLAGRIRNKGANWLPTPFALFFIRESGNVIDFRIPIQGNLKDPNFKVKDIVWDIVRNIFSKPATTIYRSQVKQLENTIEKSISLKWEMRSGELNAEQNRFISRMADFLQDHPEATISVFPTQYAEREMEYIQAFEAKKKCVLRSRESLTLVLSRKDSLWVEEMSVRDPVFNKFLAREVNDTTLNTLLEKYNIVNDQTIMDAQFSRLMQSREKSFLNAFIRAKIVSQVHMQPSKNSVPYNGFSFYRIEYNFELPEYLSIAYRQMDEFDGLAPRKRFEEKREDIEDQN